MKTGTQHALAIAFALAGLTGCATAPSYDETREQAIAMMKASFKVRGQAKLDRLDQDDMQRLCSQYVGEKVMPKEIAQQLEKAQQALVKYPADGKLLGDWKRGERIAQSGVGKQFSDDPARPAGGNCYACHQLTKQELAYGTIGPSLYNFAKTRGFGADIQRYAYGKVFNSQAFTACSSMPRFGHAQILTEEQMKDVVALLMSPDSPVNK
ncbi:MAG TPA: sulfur oxidation c-type cytochrome SoxX [Usitatibacteraceae bacterium]|nr:sulfur oxidation c-type cytochrome SoxX [Usitatibacteraceae bacterium]